VFCIWAERCVATSYGDDHHHCLAGRVSLLLIEDVVLLARTVEVKILDRVGAQDRARLSKELGSQVSDLGLHW
jgi:hypothetical protein